MIGNGAFTYTEPYSYGERKDSYNESLIKKLEYSKNEFDSFSSEEREEKDEKKNKKFNLFKKTTVLNTAPRKDSLLESRGSLKKELISNRHVYNFSNPSTHFTSSLQRNNKNKEDDSTKVKKSISFSKNMLSDDGTTCSGGSSCSDEHKSLKELEPLVLKNHSSLVNSNGLLTAAVSFKTTTLNKNTKSSSLSTSSSLNSLNENQSNKMITFGNSNNHNRNNAGENSNSNNLHLSNSIKRNTPSKFNKNNSITALNLNSTTNTTVTSTASSSASTGRNFKNKDLE